MSFDRAAAFALSPFGTLLPMPDPAGFSNSETPLADVSGRVSNHASRLLAEGSQGSVYSSQNPVTSSPWAVKVCKTQDSINSLCREDMILSYLEGPHTVEKRGLVRSQQKAELRMKRMESPDLFTLIHKNPERFTSAVLFDIAKKGLEALHFFQSKGVVHSDIKTENCFYDFKTGKLTFIDFGHAFFQGVENWSGGTFGYLSPEKLLDLPVSFGIDMWALGVMLFEAYVGGNMFCPDEPYNAKDLIYAFAQQFGDPFLEYLGMAVIQKRDGYSLEEIRKIFKSNYLQLEGKDFLTPPSIKRDRVFSIPWRDRIRSAAAQKGEQAEPIIRFLERIFTCENRMTPEEGLRAFFPTSLSSGAFPPPLYSDSRSSSSFPENSDPMEEFSPG